MHIVFENQTSEIEVLVELNPTLQRTIEHSESYPDDAANINQHIDNYAGLVAFSPDDGLLCYSRNIMDLQSCLHSLLPQLVEEHEEILSEGGTWFCFIEHLLVRGLQIYIATEAAIQSMESNEVNVQYKRSQDTRHIWISTEEKPCRVLSIAELNIFLANSAWNAAMEQSLSL